MKKRIVRWSNGVRVVLIPTRDEYKYAGISRVIWWHNDDYSNFKSSAMKELKFAMEAMRVDSKEARRELYQPTSDDTIFRQTEINLTDQEAFTSKDEQVSNVQCDREANHIEFHGSKQLDDNATNKAALPSHGERKGPVHPLAHICG